MIFVTIGSSVKGRDFTRLVEAMDRIAGHLQVDVLIQRGPVDYEPKHARHFRYARFDRMLDLFRTADLIVGHCGTGTVLNALRFQKPLIVVPRRLAEGELDMDDHQLELAHVLEDTEGVQVVLDTLWLENAVRAALESPQVRPQPSERRKQLVETIRGLLTERTKGDER